MCVCVRVWVNITFSPPPSLFRVHTGLMHQTHSYQPVGAGWGPAFKASLCRFLWVQDGKEMTPQASELNLANTRGLFITIAIQKACSFAAHWPVREVQNSFFCPSALSLLWVIMLPDNLLLSKAFSIFLSLCVCVCLQCMLLMKSSTVVHVQSIIHSNQKAQCLVAPQFLLNRDPSCSVKVGHNWILFCSGNIVQNVVLLHLATVD